MRGMAAKPKGKFTVAKAAAEKSTKGQPSLEEFVDRRDYTGALALLEFKLRCQDGEMRQLLLWIGYCSFHLGNFHRAEEAYRELLDAHDVGDEIYLFQACCHFYQQNYDDATRCADRGPPCALKNRLLFNIAHRTADEAKLMSFHKVSASVLCALYSAWLSPLSLSALCSVFPVGATSLLSSPCLSSVVPAPTRSTRS